MGIAATNAALPAKTTGRESASAGGNGGGGTGWESHCVSGVFVTSTTLRAGADLFRGFSRRRSQCAAHSSTVPGKLVSYVKDMAEAVTDEQTLASRLRLAVMRLNRRLRAQRGGESTITLTQLAALATLNRHGPMSAGDLAARERVQPPSMSRVLGRLQERGFVVRGPHASDGRQTVIDVTDQGKAYLDSEIAAREAWLDARLAELSPQEREVLCRAIEIIDGMAGH